MSKGVVETIAGAIQIAVGAVLEFIPGGQAIGTMLIISGAGMVLSGVGTMLSKGPLTGTGSATRNPVGPWNILYGRGKVGGTIVYLSEFDDDNKYLDMVCVLASHACQSVDALLFDGQRIRLDANGCSFSPPSDQTGPNITSITRSNGIVTVDFASAITDLETGDFLIIKNVTGDLTFNGKYPVTVITSTSVSYVCGGADGTGTGGQTETTWPDYRAKVHMEVLLGDHSATFPGMLTGTPYDGDPGSPVVRPDNPWTAAHKLLGKCCVFLRLHYNDEVFANGIPAISFRLSGKNDIFDPRDSSTGYTENAALCIADFLSNTTWGFKAAYSTEIPDAELIAAANVCDEAVDLAAGGFEARYTCNGSFPLTMRRGEILQNLLTSCAGRLTYTGGQFFIWPAACVEPSLLIPSQPITSIELTVWAEAVHWNGTAFVANFLHGTPRSPLSIGGSANVSTGAFGAQTTTIAPTTDLSTLSVGFFLEYSGALIDNPAPGDVWRIYDAFVTVTYFDGSRAIFRAVTATADNASFSSGQIEHASRAIDADALTPTTYAEVERWHFSNLSDPASLTLSNFSSPVGGSGATGSPDTSALGLGSSGLTLANAAGPFRWKQKAAIRDLYNGVKGTYISPANNWQSSDIPPYAQDTLHGYASGSPLYPFGDANMAEDGGDRRWLDIQLPFTISVSTAQRLCKIELLRRRHQGTGTFIFNMALYQLTALDVIQMNLPVLGWTAKILEVTAHRFTLNRQNVNGLEVTLLGTEIDVQETDCSVYDWDPSEELSAHGFQQAVLPTNKGTLDGIVTKVNAQTGTTYTAVASDRGQLVSFSNPSPVAVNLTTAGTLSGQLDEMWNANFQNTGTGTVTITPSGGQTIDGAASFVLKTGDGAHIFSDGTNFYTERGISSPNFTFVDNETPTPTSPLTAVFTLAHAPNPASSLQLFLDGVQQIAGTDFTLSSATITFTVVPDSDDIVRAFYRY